MHVPRRAGDRERPARTPNLARVLATSGGFVDAVGYVALFRLFTAHQSGNSDGLGVALAMGQWNIAWHRFSAIGAFVVGVLLGSLIVEQLRSRSRARWSGVAVAAAELLALAVALGVGTGGAVRGVISPADTVSYAAAATSLAAAMGLQNVILRRVGSGGTPTTFVSGILTVATELFASGLHQRRGEDRRRTLLRSGFLGSLWLLYLVGAIAGAGAESAWGFSALGVPMAVVAGVIAWQARTGWDVSLTSSSRGEPQSGPDDALDALPPEETPGTRHPQPPGAGYQTSGQG